MPVLVWIKGEEPTYKACHTVGKFKCALDWGQKAVPALYEIQYYLLARRMALGVVYVVFEHYQCPNGTDEGIMGHKDVV